MKSFKIALLAAACASLALVSSAEAANRAAQGFPVGSVDATPASTFATTSFADLPGATLTLTPQVDPNRVEAPGTPAIADNIVVEFTADVTKATATTGTCGIFVNGAQLAKTARTVTSAAGESSIAFVGAIANTTTGAQTVKVQCKSGDTNVFTVNQGTLRVVESF
jgi:hypothetical protein